MKPPANFSIKEVSFHMDNDIFSLIVAAKEQMKQIGMVDTTIETYQQRSFMFRHSRAMHLYRSGMPMPLLSEWLGHAQIETTIKYYANADIRMKQEAIEKATSNLNPILSSQIDFTFNDDEDTFKKLYGLM